MARNYITINGLVEKEPKLNKDKSVTLMFLIKDDDIKEFPELKKVRNSYCLVRVSGEQWDKVKHNAKEKLTIGGYAGANTNAKGTPFIEVIAKYIVPDKNVEARKINPKWRSESEVQEIKLDDIILDSDCHLETLRLSIDGVVLKKVKANGKVTDPVCVRPLGNGKYDLTIGLNRYITAKMLSIETIPCVISDLDRIALGEKYGLDKIGKYNKKPNNKQQNNKKQNNKKQNNKKSNNKKPNNKQQNNKKQDKPKSKPKAKAPTRSIQY